MFYVIDRATAVYNRIIIEKIYILFNCNNQPFYQCSVVYNDCAQEFPLNAAKQQSKNAEKC